MNVKKSIRSEWQKRSGEKSSLPHWGKAAERLRRLGIYREAVTVFAAPHESLFQARVNCLVDGKNLLMPGPGLREGFFLLPARSIAFKDIATAVTYRGLEKHGHRLKEEGLARLSVSLLLTGALAVDHLGSRIGDGQGYFDLCAALLQEMSCLENDAEVMAFVLDEQISRDKLPQEKWDVGLTGVVTPSQILQFEPSGRKPQIIWDILPMNRIKRIDPLWKLYVNVAKSGD